MLLREADQIPGETADLARELTDTRDSRTVRYTPVELLRQHLYALAMGYRHRDHQETLAHDAAMKRSVWDRRG